MEYRELDQAEYDRKLRLVIVGAEGLHAHAQNVVFIRIGQAMVQKASGSSP